MRIFACTFLLIIVSMLKADAQNMAGTYYCSKEVPFDKNWLGLEERTLVLNTDSTFTYFIHYALSDFPGDYKGKWSIVDKKIKLLDQDPDKGLTNPIVILFDIKSETELAGKEKKEKFILVRK